MYFFHKNSTVNPLPWTLNNRP
ncbi:hypothetical protein MED222_06170 [Vibrio sp. MED222]|nr:hypothetical protein MED222_06170 [Vibrio sp. MED222]